MQYLNTGEKILVAILVLAGVVAIFSAGLSLGREMTQKEAVEQGYAEWFADSTSDKRQFRWKECK